MWGYCTTKNSIGGVYLRDAYILLFLLLKRRRIDTNYYDCNYYSYIQRSIGRWKANYLIPNTKTTTLSKRTQFCSRSRDHTQQTLSLPQSHVPSHVLSSFALSTLLSLLLFACQKHLSLLSILNYLFFYACFGGQLQSLSLRDGVCRYRDDKVLQTYAIHICEDCFVLIYDVVF